MGEKLVHSQQSLPQAAPGWAPSCKGSHSTFFGLTHSKDLCASVRTSFLLQYNPMMETMILTVART